LLTFVLVAPGDRRRLVRTAFSRSGPGWQPTPVAALPDYASCAPPVGACRQPCLGDGLAPRGLLATPMEFEAALGPFLEQCRTGAWHDRGLARLGAGRRQFFDLDRRTSFQSKHCSAPSPSGSKFRRGRACSSGDLHGDIHALPPSSLNRDGHLDGFRVSRPDMRIVFLGDYTDRGRHGVGSSTPCCA
jgi:hypothetical protein